MPTKRHLVLISGRSGAGKTVTAHALEDAGFFVVDNLPPPLFKDLLTLTKEKVAVVVDVRESQFLSILPKKWSEISEKEYKKNLIFLDASDQKLIERYQETRRKHPLDDGCGIIQALKNEEKILQPIYALADKKINTDKFNSHELKKVIKNEIIEGINQSLTITLLSFGYKNGVPKELDLCFDLRFLKNPYYDRSLRPLSGKDPLIKDYIFALPQTIKFIDMVCKMIEFLYPLYQEEGKSSLTIALGCTGGQHRSVAVAEELKRRLEKLGKLRLEHRDIKEGI